MTAGRPPSLSVERALFADGAPIVLACDEVGRGALAGPVTVGIVVIRPDVRRMPAGLRDSKLLPEPKRELLAPRAASWVLASAVGEASADEIDALGIMACLGLAGARAYRSLADTVELAAGAPLLLDGNHDWLSASIEHRAQVITRIKADRDCASVSAASVIAKVHRDRGMRREHDELPLYAWDENKGYSTRAHFAALDRHGPSRLHRHTWLHAKDDAVEAGPALFDLGVG
ncbi:ribonuclease HII [Agromyces sp. CFH 90414]|uniref:Ribonuclease n=1 Tax=Agromyces agglutinans TaxID=2662258 RepID=A0A6I2F4N3_9MICO|nr:ribonuclease HII [Agromyces agglutinans]MRG58687.1 ribonuclease HII [Agromyces agglutinans]